MNIPIAMLHHVAEEPHPSLQKWCISHSKFLEFLNCIEQKGLQTTTFHEIITLKLKAKDLKNKVIITFDDCPASLFDFAIPELVKRNMKGVFFMPSEHIDGLNIWDIEEYAMVSVKLMNADQLKELTRLGMEVGSHGEKHIKLNTVEEISAFHDIADSKKTLESLLGNTIYSFAYPYGLLPKHYQKMLIKAGYKFGISIYTPFEDQYALRRFAIHETDQLQTIKMKLSRRYHLIRNLYDPIFLLKNYFKN